MNNKLINAVKEELGRDEYLKRTMARTIEKESSAYIVFEQLGALKK